MCSLNTRNELATHCRHERKRLLDKTWVVLRTPFFPHPSTFLLWWSTHKCTSPPTTWPILVVNSQVYLKPPHTAKTPHPNTCILCQYQSRYRLANSCLKRGFSLETQCNSIDIWTYIFTFIFIAPLTSWALCLSTIHLIVLYLNICICNAYITDTVYNTILYVINIIYYL